MKYSIFSKFRTVGNKPATVKLPSQVTPKATSSFDDMLKKSRSSKLRREFGTDMPKSFYERPPLISLSQERASKVGRRVESGALGRMSKIRNAAASRIKAKRLEFGKEKTKLFTRTNVGLKPTPFAKKVREKITSLQTRAFNLAETKGVKAEARMSEKLGIGVKRFGSSIASKPKTSKSQKLNWGFDESNSNPFDTWKFR
jgi:hypothetical protein